MYKSNSTDKLELLNNHALGMVLKYSNLNFDNNIIVNCPYYIDLMPGFMIDLMRKSNISEENITLFYDRYKNNEVEYGWFSGKGLPSEIYAATKNLLDKYFKDKPTTKEGIIQLMKLRGIGIDCSGLVYQSLLYAFENLDLADEFNKSLDWLDHNKQGARRADVKAFEGSASQVIDFPDIQPLDLVVMKRHMGIVLKKDGKLIIAQSVPWDSNCEGVNCSGLDILGGNPVFDFKPTMGDSWGDKYKNGELKFRRLSILK